MSKIRTFLNGLFSGMEGVRHLRSTLLASEEWAILYEYLKPDVGLLRPELEAGVRFRHFRLNSETAGRIRDFKYLKFSISGVPLYF